MNDRIVTIATIALLDVIPLTIASVFSPTQSKHVCEVNLELDRMWVRIVVSLSPSPTDGNMPRVWKHLPLDTAPWQKIDGQTRCSFSPDHSWWSDFIHNKVLPGKIKGIDWLLTPVFMPLCIHLFKTKNIPRGFLSGMAVRSSAQAIQSEWVTPSSLPLAFIIV